MNLDKAKLLVSAVQRLSAVRSLQQIMDIVRTTARLLTGADGATFILKENGQCYYADEDAISPLWKGQRFPMTACISGWSMIHKEVAVIEDIYADDRIPHNAYRPTFVKSLAMVPIRREDPIGAIGNYWSQAHAATEEEIFLLQSLADATSVSIENVYLYNEMEEKIKERTHQLEEANKTLQTFNYSASHDLGAPLRMFQIYTDMLSQKYGSSLDAQGKNILDRLSASATGMNELLAGLMNFSKTGGVEMTTEEVLMNNIVNEIYRDICENNGAVNVSFTINELPTAMGDTVLIKQVWYNLISNAVKYSSRKEYAEIEIGAVTTDDEIHYYVKDNGDGFDMKYYDKLFHIFQRLHNKEEFVGNGVGLALCEKIISRHNGKIWAESQPGYGATFYFSLPRKQMVGNAGDVDVVKEMSAS